MKYFKRMRSENIKLNMCRNRVWHTCFIPRIKTQKTKTTKLRKKRSMQLLRECWSFLTKLMTCQNLKNKLLNITVLFIWYLLASLKKMSLIKHGNLYFILAKKMVSHTIDQILFLSWIPEVLILVSICGGLDFFPPFFTSCLSTWSNSLSISNL